MRIKGLRACAVIALAVSGAAISAGCASRPAAQGQQPTMLQTAATSLLAGDYNAAVTTYTDFLGSTTDASQMAEAFLGRGNAYFKLERYDLAEADFKSALSRAPNRAMKAQATMWLANSVAAQDRFDAAEKMYRQLASSYAGVAPQDEVTYRLGLMLARQGKWDDAAASLEEVISAWPSGEYARYAGAKLVSVKERSFTVQVGAYSSRASADRKSSELEARGLPVRIEMVDTDGAALYAVRSGQFPTWQAASEHADKLKAAGFSALKLP